jgi:DNA-binding IclR family transcriptional regulator
MSTTYAYFVARTVRALELLAFGPLSAPQLARALQIHPVTARRMLSRLVEEEYVTRLDGPRCRYALTTRLVAVAGQWLEHAELPRLAAPFVARLHAATTLTAHLVVPSYDRVACLVHAGDAGIPEPRLRELVPAHCTAGGKALLAERDRWRESLLSRPLHAYTDRTITDPREIEHEVIATRQRGYAIEDGEYQPDVRAVAAPIHDPAGDTIAAIGVSTTGSLDAETVSDDVAGAAAALTAEIARHTPPQPLPTRAAER